MRMARRFIQWLSGSSRPAVFADRNGDRWVVKYQNNRHGCRALANEWINYKLAGLLDLPTPEADIVDIPHELVIVSNLKTLDHEYIAPGLSFGCKFIEYADNQALEYQMGRLNNGFVIPGVVLFDTWVDNYDRTGNFYNLLVSPSTIGTGRYTYHLIDLEVIGAMRWKSADLRERQDQFVIHRENPHYAQHLKQPSGFDQYLDKLEAIERQEISEIVYSVPTAWGLAPDESEVVIEYLDYRRTKIRSILKGL